MGPALVQHRKPEAIHISTSFFSNLAIGIVLYVVVIFSTESISSFFNSEDLIGILPVLCFAFVFSSVANSSVSLIQRDMNFKYLFIAENVSHLIGMAVGVVLAVLDFGVWSLVYGTLVYQFLQMVLVLFKTRIQLSPGWSKSIFMELFHFGAGLTLIRVNNYFTNSGVNLLLGKLLPMNVLGIFERSYRTMMIPGKMLGDVLDKVMFPAMSREQDNNDSLTAMYQRNLSFSLILTLPLGIWLSINSEAIVLLLLGNNWLEAVPVLQVLFMAVPFRVTMRLTDSVIRAKGLVYLSAWRKFLYTIFLFVALYFGSKFGLYGLSWTILIASALQYLNMSSLAVSKMKMPWSTQWKPFMEAVPMSLLFTLSAFAFNVLTPGDALYLRLIFASMGLVSGLFLVLLFYRFWPRVLGESAQALLLPVHKMVKKRTGIKLKGR
jgi:PST family polysaccharide transporter